MDLTIIPPELHYEIIAFLPLQYLLKVGCIVCKSWFQFIMETDSVWREQQPLISKKNFSLVSTSWKLYQLQEYYKKRHKYQKKPWIEFSQPEKLIVPQVNSVGNHNFAAHTGAMCLCKLDDQENYVLVFAGGNRNHHGIHSTSIFEATLPLTGENIIRPIVFPNSQSRQKAPHYDLWRNTGCIMNDFLVYIFGGIEKGVKTNNLYVYNCRTKQIERLEGTGDIPSARADHAACSDGKDLMYVFGGSNVLVQPENDLYVYSASQNNWKYIPMSGSVPSKRSAHKLVHITTNKLLMQGGAIWTTIPEPHWEHSYTDEVFIAHLDTLSWAKVVASPYKLTTDVFPSVILMDNYLISIGGGTSSGVVSNEVSVLNVVTWEREKVDRAIQRPTSDVLMQRIPNTNQVYYFGGFAGLPLDDICTMKLPFIQQAQQKETRYKQLTSLILRSVQQ